MNISYRDAHLHLNQGSYELNALLLQWVQNLGFYSLWVNTTRPSEWRGVQLVARNHQQVLPFFGIHPWYADDLQANWSNLLYNLLKNNSPWGKVGIGEIGLDKNCATPPKLQEEVFIQQLEMAQQLNLPVTIHCLKRWGRIVKILEERQPTVPLIFHAYNGSYDVMKRLMQHHSLFSFQYRAITSSKQQQLLQKMPLEHILLETDLCHPVEEGAENQAHQKLVHFYSEVAELRGMDPIEFAYQVGKNGEI